MHNIWHEDLSPKMTAAKRKTRSRTLAQTTVRPAVLREFDKIAENQGHTRSAYLRLLITREVRLTLTSQEPPQ